MGLKIILFVYFWLYCCITNLNLRNTFFWTNYLLLLNENTNNFNYKFYFCPNLFSYRFEPNFKKWFDSNKSRFIFLGKRFSSTWSFPIFEIELIIIKCSNLFIKILFWKIVFFIISAIKEFIFKNWKRSSCRECFS